MFFDNQSKKTEIINNKVKGLMVNHKEIFILTNIVNQTQVKEIKRKQSNIK